MKSVWKWILGIVLVLAVLAAVIGAPFLYRSVYGDDFVGMGWHMRVPLGGIRNFPMHWPFFSFGGMFLMSIFRLGWLVLLGLGIYWLVRTLRQPRPAARACVSCGKPLQMDWAHCPYCGARV